MTDRDRQGIGHIGWFGNGLQREVTGYGQLHLVLWGPPISSQHFFHLSCRVGNQRQIALTGCQADHSTSVTHDDGCLRTLVVTVKFFQAYAIGLERINYLQQAIMDRLQSQSQILRANAANDACFDKLKVVALNAQYAVTGDIQAGINAEDSNWRISVQGFWFLYVFCSKATH